MPSSSLPSATASLPSSRSLVRLLDLHNAVLQNVSPRRFDGLLKRYRDGTLPLVDGLNHAQEQEGGYAEPLLHLVVENGRAALLARLLREPGLDLEARDGEDQDGDTALFLATYSPGSTGSAPSIIAQLLDAGARHDGTMMLGTGTQRGPATLVQAVLWMPAASTPAVLDVLHQRGLLPVAELDAQQDGLLHGMLDHAHLMRVTKGDPAPVVEWLIAHGADPHRKNAQGHTVAARLSHPDVRKHAPSEQVDAMLRAIERQVLHDTAGWSVDPSGTRPVPARARSRL